MSTPTICLRKAFKQDTQKVLHVQNRHGLGHHCSHNTLNEDILPCRICQCNIATGVRSIKLSTQSRAEAEQGS